jgi:D-glycero-D-manno-heptose 1,7-bisphosphate phosphatase
MQIIILDRDGVINKDSDEFIKSPDEWQALPGSLEAIARLTQAGYRILVATNQSGIARKLYDVHTLNKINHKMHQQVIEHGGLIEAIFFCPHGPNDDCNCRKPRTGMFEQIASRLNIDLTDVFAIGDSLRDIQAAQDAGAIPVLVRTGKGTRTLYEHGELLEDVPIYCDLAQAVEHILNPAE